MKITNANHEAVKYACMNFHYAKSVPAVKYAYNFYNDSGEWCGVIIFSSGATPRIGSPFGLAQGEVLELVRVALNGKQSCTSQCVGMALRKLHQDAPQIKLIVSFADVDQQHFGTIYQATNWIYLGQYTDGMVSAFIINGKKIHRRSCGAKGWKQSIQWIREHVDPNAEEFITAGKRKYIFVYDKKMRKEWMKKAVPYPKKENVTD